MQYIERKYDVDFYKTRTGDKYGYAAYWKKESLICHYKYLNSVIRHNKV